MTTPTTPTTTQRLALIRAAHRRYLARIARTEALAQRVEASADHGADDVEELGFVTPVTVRPRSAA